MSKPSFHKKPAAILAPGMLAWASTWPDWETIEGQESPHPVLALGANEQGEIAVLPLSSKADLGKAQLELLSGQYPSAFKPKGPLGVSPSYVCIADRQWNLTLRWIRAGQDCMILPKGKVPLRRITPLADGEWARIKVELSRIVKDVEERQH